MKRLSPSAERGLYGRSRSAWAIYIAMKHAESKKQQEGLGSQASDEQKDQIRKAYQDDDRRKG